MNSSDFGFRWVILKPYLNGRLQPYTNGRLQTQRDPSASTCPQPGGLNWLALAFIMLRTFSPSLRPCPCPLIHVVPARRSAVLKAAGESKEARCPFSLSAGFMLEGPRPQELSPLGRLSVFSDRPATAHLWLAAAGETGSRQAREGAEQQGQRLVSGLRRLTHEEEYLPQDQEGDRHSRELRMKRRGFDTRREHTFVAEPGSLPAQAEALELLLEYLPQRFPHMYSVRGGEADSGGTGGGIRVVSVTVQSTGETHLVADYADRPLELCGRLVQVGFRADVGAW